MEPDLITRTEQAMIDRLKTGLGRMVNGVESYAGELDDDLPNVVRKFPAAWVTFGGVTKSEPTGTSRARHKVSAQFTVMVGQISRRGGSAARQGVAGEIGTNQLQYAVRRLLGGQDFGLQIDHLQPGKIRTLYNTRIDGNGMQVFALEFTTAWIETLLENGQWPAPTGADDPDQLFASYGGHTGAGVADFVRFAADIGSEAPAVQAVITLPKE